MNSGPSSKNLTDNVALLFTARPFVLGPHLDKICLPSASGSSGAIFPRGYDPYDCYATGWGKDAFGDEGKFQASEGVIPQNCHSRNLLDRRMHSCVHLQGIL